MLSLISTLVWCWCRLPCSIYYAIVFKQLLHLFVGISAITFDDSMHDTLAPNEPIDIHLHDDAVAKFLFIGAKGADKVAQSLGQHRDSAVYQIHGCGTLLRLFVDDRLLGNIVCHVSNVDANFPNALAYLTNRQGIVEILGIFGVNRAGEHLPEVFSFSQILRGNLGTDSLRSLFNCLGILVWQAILSQDGVHLRIVIASFSQHVDNLSYDVFMILIGPFAHFHHHLVVGLAALQLVSWNQNVVGKQVFLCHQEGDVLFNSQFTNELIARTLQYFDDLCLFDVLLTARHERHFHAVTIECRHRVALGNKDGFVASIGDERVLPITFAPKKPFHHLSHLVETV